jgi:hypothetical protein
MSDLKPVLYKKFNAKRVQWLTEVNDKFAQNSYTIKYDHPNSGPGYCTIQTETFKITQGGIPRIDEYHLTQRARGVFERVYDPSNPKSVVARKKMEELDVIFGSDKFKRELFGEDGVDDHEYTPIVRVKRPSKPKKGEAPKKQREYYPYSKCKIALAYAKDDDEDSDKKKKKKGEPAPEDPNPAVLTKVYVPGKNGREFIVKPTADGVVPPYYMEDVGNKVRWQSEVLMIYTLSSIWEMKSADKYGKIPYGVTIKVRLIEVKTVSSQGATIDDSTIQDDSDDDTETSKADKVQASDDDDDDEDSDADEKPAKKGKVMAKANEDSDEDSDDDEKPAKSKASAGKGKVMAKKASSGSDSDAPPKKAPVGKGKVMAKKASSGSDSDAPPAKGKALAKAAKKASSGSDNDSDEDSDTPLKKVVAKGKAVKGKKANASP